jgi:hypothetical protein
MMMRLVLVPPALTNARKLAFHSKCQLATHFLCQHEVIHLSWVAGAR